MPPHLNNNKMALIDGNYHAVYKQFKMIVAAITPNALDRGHTVTVQGDTAKSWRAVGIPVEHRFYIDIVRMVKKERYMWSIEAKGCNSYGNRTCIFVKSLVELELSDFWHETQ